MQTRTVSTKPIAGALIGRIIGVDAEGNAVVDHPQSPSGAGAARVATPCPDTTLEGAVGRAVVLVFEEGDPARPIVVGWLDDVSNRAPHRTLRVDGHTVVVAAEKRLELVCGESSITLTEDGKILVKGVNVLNQATELNKIRGAAVRIN